MHYSKQALKHAKCEIRMIVRIVKFREVPLTALQKIMLFTLSWFLSQHNMLTIEKYITNLAWFNIDMKIEDWKPKEFLFTCLLHVLCLGKKPSMSWGYVPKKLLTIAAL